jgi:hypothetical protein
MDAHRTTERTVGTLFIAATVASIAGSVALGSVLEGPDYLIDLSAQQGRVISAALLFLLAATSAFATSFLLFPILRKHAEGLAAGYVGLRAFENLFYIAGIVALLAMLTMSQHDAIGTAAPDLALLGATLLAPRLVDPDRHAALLRPGGRHPQLRPLPVPARPPLVVDLGAHRRPVGAQLRRARPPRLRDRPDLGSPLMILAMPIALQELVFAGWLIARGFDRPTIDRSQTPPEPRESIMASSARPLR